MQENGNKWNNYLGRTEWIKCLTQFGNFSEEKRK